MSSDKNLFLFSHKEFEVTAPKWVRSLWNDQDFVDVTLATADERHIDVHKVILSCASPFFRNILVKNVHIKPLIFLKDILYEDLKNILEFIYNGETSVANERLENFLVSARELGITELNQDNHETKKNILQSISSILETTTTKYPVLTETKKFENIGNHESKIEESIESEDKYYRMNNSEMFYVMPEKVKVEQAPKVCCQKCGRKYSRLGNLLAHMKETCIIKKRKFVMNRCNVCNKEVKNYNFNQHMKKHEKKPIQCDLCTVTKVSQLLIEKHKVMRHLEFICPICNIIVEGRSKLKIHRENRHRPNKIRKCKYCSKELTTRSGMFTHVQKCLEVRNKVSQMKDF